MMKPFAIQAGALIDYVGIAEVFPRHLILARELNSDRLAGGLR